MVSSEPPPPPILSFKKTCKFLKIKQNKPCGFIQTEVSVSWRDGSAIKSACAPPKELQFSSHHPLVKPSVTLVLGTPMTLVSSGTCTCVHILPFTHSYRSWTSSQREVMQCRRTRRPNWRDWVLFCHCLLSIKYKENSSFKILFEIFLKF